MDDLNERPEDAIAKAWTAVVHNVEINPWETDPTAPAEARLLAEGWNRCRQRVLDVLAEVSSRGPNRDWVTPPQDLRPFIEQQKRDIDAIIAGLPKCPQCGSHAPEWAVVDKADPASWWGCDDEFHAEPHDG